MKSLRRFLFPLIALVAIALSFAGAALAREMSETDFFSASEREIEITGVVESFDGTTLVIDGQTIVVPVSAEIKGEIVAGQVVKVHALVGADNTLTAREIEPAMPGVIGDDDPDDDTANINADDDLDDSPDDDSANVNANDDMDDLDDDSTNINANDDMDDDLDDDSANINADDDLDDDSSNINAGHDDDDNDNSGSNSNSGHDDDDDNDNSGRNSNSGDDDDDNDNSGHDDDDDSDDD